jgi:hypothetical protein
LLASCVDPRVGHAEPLDWDSVPERVWIEQWRKEVVANQDALGNRTVAEVATLATEAQSIGRLVRFDPGYLPDDDERSATATRLLAIALGVTLYDSGWTVSGGVGEPLTFSHDGEIIEPFGLTHQKLCFR